MGSELIERQVSCILIGGRSLLIQCGKLLLEAGHSLACVISSDPLCRDWAAEEGIPSAAGLESLPALVKEPVDYLFSIVNFQLLPDAVLAFAKELAINFHDGPLPGYAGLNVTSWALINGEQEHAINWHQMSGGVDQGGIIQSRVFEVSEQETAFTLNAKCFAAGIDCFEEIVRDLGGETLPVKPQNEGIRGYFAKNKRPEGAGFIRWMDSAEQISRLVRGLDYGPGYPNPLVCAKTASDAGVVLVGSAQVVSDQTKHAPGTITGLDDAGIRVATGQGEVRIGNFRTLAGKALSLDEFIGAGSLHCGGQLGGPADFDGINESLALLAGQEKYWQSALAEFEPQSVPYSRTATEQPGLGASGRSPVLLTLEQDSGQLSGLHLLAAVLLYLARINNGNSVQIPLQTARVRGLSEVASEIFCNWIPFAASFDLEQPFQSALEVVAGTLEKLEEHEGFCVDLIARTPGLAHCLPLFEQPLSLALIIGGGTAGPASVHSNLPTAALVLEIPEAGNLTWHYDQARIEADEVRRMIGQLEVLSDDLARNPDKAVGDLNLVPESDRQLLEARNRTGLTYDRRCIHHLIEAQVERTPDAPALACGDAELSYRQLNSRANQLARLLVEKGARPGEKVGVLVSRSAEMVVALLGVLKSGAAYVPLDPEYPRERLEFMAGDAGLCCLITEGSNSLNSLGGDIPLVSLEQAGFYQASFYQARSEENLVSEVTPDDLAYVIYTSGSTGKPKGVMVEHGNVANFFAGMDRAIGHEKPGVWLAVTSISFDISVLELFWTLARGFKVVLYLEPKVEGPAKAGELVTRYPEQAMQFSLFYWNVAADEDEQADYELLLESARYGDRNGFSAVWTPERHFGGFGGLYPNPAVSAAAVAAVTENISIRAGSCVLPLHDPIRVAEEWSMVDRLSGGRAGIAAAAGWMPNDFVLMPDNYPKAKESMFDAIETVQKLWRGESIRRAGPEGPVEIAIRPRPVQAELPLWITTAGNPGTFIKAARMGANLLTHLLGQSVEQVKDNISIYRKTWADCGHPGRGQVTLLLHTLVGDDDEFVKHQARGPMKSYLSSAVSLVKDAAWEFPTYEKVSAETGHDLDEFFDTISEVDMDGLLEFAFERYYGTSGLFGSPARCLEMVDRLKEIGVDEIGCLIDFGVDSGTVLKQLPDLGLVRRAANPRPANPEAVATNGDDQARYPARYPIDELIRRHHVTHLQCTPSQASMLVADEMSRAALAQVGTMMVGGEALPPELADQLSTAIGGDLINMYGPTETTVWSATYRVQGGEERMPLGDPIANTSLYIMDSRQQLLPLGVPGELVIGGDGVVRGYHNRPELTGERFLPDPFSEDGRGRIYRTGDLAAISPKGSVQFFGRLDFQVKLRGYRIELGEIEQVLRQAEGVQEAVVLVREDRPGDQQLVAYLTLQPGRERDEAPLQARAAEKLPGFMQPSCYLFLPKLPLTPNGKIDRKSLPPPTLVEKESEDFVAPESDMESLIADIWRGVLGREQISSRDNFFDIGGHSLLVVQVLQQLRKNSARPVQLTDLFRFPTIGSLATFLQSEESAAGQVEASRDRGAARRSSRLRRRRNRETSS